MAEAGKQTNVHHTLHDAPPPHSRKHSEISAPLKNTKAVAFCSLLLRVMVRMGAGAETGVGVRPLSRAFFKNSEFFKMDKIRRIFGGYRTMPNRVLAEGFRQILSQ